MPTPNKIIISRTDSIGDVMLTLPLTGILKQYFPKIPIVFLAKTYTLPVLKCCQHIDEIADWSLVENKSFAEQVKFLKSFKADTIVHVFPSKQIAKAAKVAEIKWRIGTGRRAYNLFNCNLKTWFTRKNSNLHEAQLNVKMLQKLGLEKVYALLELSKFSEFKNIYTLPDWIKIDPLKKNIILHPKSKGSAAEWGIPNFNKLIELLAKENVKVFVTGTAAEEEIIAGQLNLDYSEVSNLLGKLSLQDLIALIDATDTIVAASTGPLHIAAALGKTAIGIYSNRRPIHPGRWAPMGENATFVNFTGTRGEIVKNTDDEVEKITPREIFNKILEG